MKALDFRHALGRLPQATPADVTRQRPFLVISPHPDDESLGLGGLIAATVAAGHGADVRVAVVTDGAGSHPSSRLYPAERLIALRKAETAEAVARLGLSPGNVTHLGCPDTRAPTTGSAFEAAVGTLVELARSAHAESCFVTWQHDPHCDHEAAAAMARAVGAALPELELWFYPVWGWHLPDDTEVAAPPPEGFRLDIAPWLDRKHAAIAAHASQMTDLIADDPDGFRFTPTTLAPFLQPFETVFRVPR